MMSLWDALRMNMMISYQELVRTFLRYESVNAFITMFIKVMGSTAAHYFAERKNSNR